MINLRHTRVSILACCVVFSSCRELPTAHSVPGGESARSPTSLLTLSKELRGDTALFILADGSAKRTLTGIVARVEYDPRILSPLDIRALDAEVAFSPDSLGGGAYTTIIVSGTGFASRHLAVFRFRIRSPHPSPRLTFILQQVAAYVQGDLVDVTSASALRNVSKIEED